MKELHGEGLASRADPESCVISRKAGREALTGAHVDGVLSREMSGNQDADLVYSWGRPHCTKALSARRFFGVFSKISEQAHCVTSSSCVSTTVSDLVELAQSVASQ
jgi:hypothetical protein